jgi:hypothetical protein
MESTQHTEVFKDCKGYEGLYQVSNTGRVWSVRYQNYVKPYILGGNYEYVLLYAKNGKRKKEYIHRLVALVFCLNPNHYPEVSHIDEDCMNNYATNLCWCTHKDNCNMPLFIERHKK